MAPSRFSIRGNRYRKRITVKRIVPNVTALVRANIMAFTEMRIDPDEFDSDHIDLSLGPDFAF